MKVASDQGYFTNQTWLFERKGNFDPNEIKFKKWAVCFKAEIKPLDFIIDWKFSGPILPSAEARGKIPVEARSSKGMCAPVDRHM